MDARMLSELKKDFREWSGGFPPESDYQVTVYVDYAMSTAHDAAETRSALLEWMCSADRERDEVRAE